jgi:hypothetical protein
MLLSLEVGKQERVHLPEAPEAASIQHSLVAETFSNVAVYMQIYLLPIAALMLDPHQMPR